MTIGRAFLGVGLCTVLVLVLIGLLLFRYAYQEPPSERAMYILRVDRLTSEVCYIPLSDAGRTVAHNTLLVEQCDQ